MSDQPGTMSNNQYFRRYTPAAAAPPQFLQAIVRGEQERRQISTAVLPVNRGAAPVARAPGYPAIFSQTLYADASNMGLAMAWLATFCRALYYPGGHSSFFEAACLGFNDPLGVTLMTGNTLPNSSYRYSSAGAGKPSVGIFRPNPIGTILVVGGITSAQTWNGQIAWDTMCETSVFKDYLDHNSGVGQTWLAWAQAVYTQLKTDFAGLGNDDIIITGHSMGGVIAQYLARLIAKDYPGKVKYVMTFGSPKPGDSHFGDQKSWGSGNGPEHPPLPYYRITTDEDPAGALPLRMAPNYWEHPVNCYWCIRSGGNITRNRIGWEDPVLQAPVPNAGHRWVWGNWGWEWTYTSPNLYLEMFVRWMTNLASATKVRCHMLRSYLDKTSWWVAKGKTDRNTQFGNLDDLLTLKNLIDPLATE